MKTFQKVFVVLIMLALTTSMSFAQITAKGDSYTYINDGDCKVHSTCDLYSNGTFNGRITTSNRHKIKGTHSQVTWVFRAKDGTPLYYVKSSAYGVNCQALGGNVRNDFHNTTIPSSVAKRTFSITIQIGETKGDDLSDKKWFKGIEKVISKFSEKQQTS